MKLPAVLVQEASAWQLPVPPEHSSMSLHSVPSPLVSVKPPGQLPHVNEPGVFVHVTIKSQLSVPSAHSSMSLHVDAAPALLAQSQ